MHHSDQRLGREDRRPAQPGGAGHGDVRPTFTSGRACVQRSILARTVRTSPGASASRRALPKSCAAATQTGDRLQLSASASRGRGGQREGGEADDQHPAPACFFPFVLAPSGRRWSFFRRGGGHGESRRGTGQGMAWDAGRAQGREQGYGWARWRGLRRASRVAAMLPCV